MVFKFWDRFKGILLRLPLELVGFRGFRVRLLGLGFRDLGL